MFQSTGWIPLPHGLGAKSHLFLIGDVHGNAHLLDPIMEWAARQPELAQRELIFLGDLIDRGHENFRTLQLASDGLPCFDTHILPGNHEITFMRFMSGENRIYDRWLNMGGATMVQEIHDLEHMASYPEIRSWIREALPIGFEDRLMNGPGYLRRGDFLLVHAGLDPMTNNPDQYLSQGMTDGEPSTHWAWIFDEFSDWTGGWDRFGTGAVIHGHQPIMTDGWDAAFQSSYAQLISHRRLNLDFGSGAMDRLGGAEIHEGRIRFFGAM